MSDDMFSRMESEQYKNLLTFAHDIDNAGDNGAGVEAIIDAADPEDAERRHYAKAAKESARLAECVYGLTKRQMEYFFLVTRYGCTKDIRIAEAWGVSHQSVTDVKAAMQKNFQKLL